MKVNIGSVSAWDKEVIIEVESIDEAIKRIQNDNDLVLQVINKDHSDIYDNVNNIVNIPITFVVTTDKTDTYDCYIEIYDNYRE